MQSSGRPKGLGQLARDAALLKRSCGLSWSQIPHVLSLLYKTEINRSRARSAARRYERRHQGEKFEQCPARLREAIEAAHIEREPASDEQFPLPATDTDEVEIVENGNELELTFRSGPKGPGEPIKTLGELERAHSIDKSVWVICGPVIHNAWSTPAYSPSKNQWTFFQNHQVKARYCRREPEPILPTINPIVPASGCEPPKRTPPKPVMREIIFGDAHIGYRRNSETDILTELHDRAALDLLVQVIEDLQPDRIHNLGDMIDAAELSDKFLREPDVLFTIQPALAEAHWWLSQIRGVAPNALISYHEGNHEDRLRRWLLAHFPVAYGLKRVDKLGLPPAMSFQNLIALDKLHIEWYGGYPNDEEWSDDLRLLHGSVARKNPGSTAWAVLQSADGHEAFGHVHKQELVSKNVYRRNSNRVVKAISPGCLCHLDGRVPGGSPTRFWQEGFVVRDFVPGRSISSELFVTVEGDSCIFDGKLYRARDRIEEIAQAFPQFKWR